MYYFIRIADNNQSTESIGGTISGNHFSRIGELFKSSRRGRNYFSCVYIFYIELLFVKIDPRHMNIQ